MPNLETGKKMVKNRITAEQVKRGAEPNDDIPKTAVLSFRGDIRDLATLARIFDLEGIKYNSKSALIATGLHMTAETLSSILQKQYDEPLLFKSTLAAEEYLKNQSRLPYNSLTFRPANVNKVTSLIQKVAESKEGIIENEQVVSEEVKKRADELLKEGEENG
ncbi:hypothetical protein LCGC14_0395630 [marine sediment metagenome]|uniref:Uncharacterized protein n=1 Tax=marine sediment metagenome TaxID=412755 RepID=A0A0F9TGG4_9ZZZZ